MNALRKLGRPSKDWNLFLRALALVILVRAALWVVPFRVLYNWAVKFRKGSPKKRDLDRHSVYKVIWAVSAAAKRVPKASCLTQALAAQIMLGRRGHQTSLQLGVMKNEAGKFDAHAWVEKDGRILIGLNDTFSKLTKLPPLEPEKQP